MKSETRSKTKIKISIHDRVGWMRLDLEKDSLIITESLSVWSITTSRLKALITFRSVGKTYCINR